MQSSVKRCAILLGSLLIFANLKAILAEVEEAVPTHKSPQLDETQKVISALKTLKAALKSIQNSATAFVSRDFSSEKVSDGETETPKANVDITSESAKSTDKVDATNESGMIKAIQKEVSQIASFMKKQIKKVSHQLNLTRTSVRPTIPESMDGDKFKVLLAQIRRNLQPYSSTDSLQVKYIFNQATSLMNKWENHYTEALKNASQSIKNEKKATVEPIEDDLESQEPITKKPIATPEDGKIEALWKAFHKMEAEMHQLKEQNTAPSFPINMPNPFAPSKQKHKRFAPNPSNENPSAYEKSVERRTDLEHACIALILYLIFIIVFDQACVNKWIKNSEEKI